MADSSHPTHTRATWMYAGLVFAAAIATDQVSKMWARTALDGQGPRPLIGQWLSLSLVHNSGAAFSFAAGKTWILTIFTVVIIGNSQSYRWNNAFLAGGAVGNLIDRLTAEPGFGVGHVTDFIAYGNWFVGNVADIWIVLGAPLLALALSREPSKEDAQ